MEQEKKKELTFTLCNHGIAIERGHVTSQSNLNCNTANIRPPALVVRWDSVPLEAQPAKRPSSPPAGSAPKKVAAPAKGLFKGHNVTTATVTSDQPTASVSTPRIPLLFLDSVPDWPTHAKKLEELARDGLTTTFRGAHYRLKVTTVEDFRAVQRYLCFNKLPFYTHNLGCERSLKVVISGLPDTDDVELFDVLTDEGFAVDEVARHRTARGPTRSWLITLTRDSERENPDTKRACQIYNVKSLLHVRVSVTVYKKPVPRFWPRLRQLREAEKMRPLRGKSSEDELPQSLDGEGSLLQLWRRSQRQLSWVSGLKGGQSGSCPVRPQVLANQTSGVAINGPAAQATARDESPANSVSESEAEDDMPQKKKRRRKPQNPANRLPRPPANTPATPPQQTEAPAADAAAEAAALAQRSLQAWPSVTHRPAARLLQKQIVPVDRQIIELNCSDTAHRPGGAPRGYPSDPTWTWTV
ncbi:hypothetical protein J6590_026788 [Homalodisca vitripennis]|nr:hypothetical protein J6590_026788 [Homalodisca vitripennis]